MMNFRTRRKSKKDLLAKNSNLDSQASIDTSYEQDIARNSLLTRLVFGDPEEDIGTMDSTKIFQLKNTIELWSTEQAAFAEIKKSIGKDQVTRSELEFAPS